MILSQSLYERQPLFWGKIGRYGNRIAKGKFSLGGTSYSLATNDGQDHLHGRWEKGSIR